MVEEEACLRVLRSGRLVQGPEGEAFEQAFALSVGSAFAIAVSSGTAALQLALMALSVGKGDEVEFWVHNQGHMPRKVQLQVFQRSFSTKGAGRGIGTYSVKLLTERYLGGRVTFTSEPQAGTTFRIRLPVQRR